MRRKFLAPAPVRSWSPPSAAWPPRWRPATAPSWASTCRAACRWCWRRRARPRASSSTRPLEIIRDRVDALGVAEPEITRQGDAIVVQLPGVKNRDRALELVGQTAELRFRPVLSEAAECPPTCWTRRQATADDGGRRKAPPRPPRPPTTGTHDGATTDGAREAALGLAEGESAARRSRSRPTTTATPPSPTTTDHRGRRDRPARPRPSRRHPSPRAIRTTADATVIAAGHRRRGGRTSWARRWPRAASSRRRGADIQSGQWLVRLEMQRRRGRHRQVQRDRRAVLPGRRPGRVPDRAAGHRARLGGAVGADDQRAHLRRRPDPISGSFSEGEAKDLALVLRYGSLPVELERQTVQTVSATLGEDSLRAGIVAGVVGLILVALYMLALLPGAGHRGGRSGSASGARSCTRS